LGTSCRHLLAGFQQRISLVERQEFDLRAPSPAVPATTWWEIFKGNRFQELKLDRAERKESPGACPVQTNWCNPGHWAFPVGALDARSAQYATWTGELEGFSV